MNRLLTAARPVLALVAAVAGCAAPPSGLDLALTHPTAAHRYVATLEPSEPPIPIGRLQAWRVRLASSEGAPVVHARIAVDGGMPQHGHGLPTKPRVTRELADGTYVIDGMKFSMGGWWEIRLAIDADAGPDQVTFNVVLDPATGRLAS